MDPEERALNYTEIICRHGEVTGYRRMTPRQSRRYQKKLKGDWGCYPNGDDYVPSYDGMPEAQRPKQHPTPRRADARRFAVEGRRFLERRRG